MELARDRQFIVWSQDERSEGVLVVHHIKEREPSERARCRQNLKESSMGVVARVSIARAPVVATADPWFQRGPDLRLNANLNIDGAGALPLRSPSACLHGAPNQQVERRCGGIKRAQSVPSHCFQANVV